MSATGIGAAAVHVLTDAGARVVATYHRTSPPEDERATWVQCDVRDAGAVDGMVDEAVRVLGGLDVLLHAAGLWQPGIPGQITGDEIDFLVDTNLKATIFTNQAAYRVMRPFLEGDPCLPDLETVLEEACGSFHHPAVAPLRQISPNSFILELFHGPTLAFKDLAMQVVARLMNRALLRKGAHATVIGATLAGALGATWASLGAAVVSGIFWWTQFRRAMRGAEGNGPVPGMEDAGSIRAR